MLAVIKKCWRDNKKISLKGRWKIVWSRINFFKKNALFFARGHQLQSFRKRAKILNVGANVGATIFQEKIGFREPIVLKDFLPITYKIMLAIDKKMLAHVGGNIR